MAGRTFVVADVDKAALEIIAENRDLERNIRAACALDPGDHASAARRCVEAAREIKERSLKATEARVKVIADNIWLGDPPVKYYRLNTAILAKKDALALEEQERVIIIS